MYYLVPAELYLVLVCLLDVMSFDTLYVVIVHRARTIRSCDEPSGVVVCGVLCRVISNHESRVVTGLTSYFTSHTAVQGTVQEAYKQQFGEIPDYLLL